MTWTWGARTTKRPTFLCFQETFIHDTSYLFAAASGVQV